MEVKEELISIVIPVYNVKSYLNKCLITVVHQSYKKLEIILVDDGSTDGSSEICNSWAYRDSRIKLIHKSNGGLSDARNVGLGAATGKYVLFVDSDDWIAVNMVQDMYDAIRKNNADMAVCEFASVHNNGMVKKNFNHDEPVQILNQKEAMKLVLEDREITSHVWRKLYKRNLLPSDLFPNGKNFEDIYAMPTILKSCHKVVCLNDVYYFYRINNDGIVRTKNMKSLEDLYNNTVHQCREIVNLYPDLRRIANTRIASVSENIWKDFIINKNTDFRKNKLKRNIYRNLKKMSIPNNIGLRNTFFLVTLKYFPVLDNISYNMLLFRSQSKVKKIGGKIKRNFRYIKQLRRITSQFKKDKPNFIVLCTPLHGNLGDRALKFGEDKFLKKFFPQYNIVTIPLEFADSAIKYGKLINKKYVKENDIVALHAGGNIGTLYPGIHMAQEKLLNKFANRRLIIFPQTFYYSKDKQGTRLLEKTKVDYSVFKRFRIFVRDAYSYKFVRKNIPKINVSLTPDIALSLKDSLPMTSERKGALLLLRSDSEATLTDLDLDNLLETVSNKFSQYYQSDTHLYYDSVSDKMAKNRLNELWSKMQNSEIVITDRLHGMIFAAITRTPCVVLKSQSPKIKGVYNWIKECNYIELVENFSDLEKAIDKVINVKFKVFPNLENEFKKMAQEIREL